MARVMTTPDGRRVLLRPLRLVRLSGHTTGAAPLQGQVKAQSPASSPEAAAPKVRVQPMPSGQSYRVLSAPEHALVTPPLSKELAGILEQFAQSNGFNAEKPLAIHFGRGTLGLHRFHRAADVYAVGGKGIGKWLQEWNAAMRKASTAPTAEKREQIVADEQARNFGFLLYKALQEQGKWAQPPGYPVQLFGPWTRNEGPHKAISDRLLYAHRDHIHVAK